jgi:3-hydroxyisobutyrate dehydrogenase-like beta-hydroxyacid dehydrogenase
MSGGRPRVTFIGFGAFAVALADGMRAGAVGELTAYVRAQPEGASRSAKRAEAAGVPAAASIAEAIESADLVVAAVPAGAARSVAEACCQALRPGTLYVDPAPLLPQEKQALAALVAAAGGEYVDAAVLGTVETEGAEVPLLVSGPGAERFASHAAALGLRVTALDGPAGRASLVKLLRSVFMKGRDALILEMLLAARKHGLETTVLDSIQGRGETVPFPDLAERVLGSLVLYGERRADELDSCAALLEESGVEPVVTRAGAERLRRLGGLDLRARFGDSRPSDLGEALDALDGLS